MLTVRQLIARLKKLDQMAVVAWRDHDQSENEVNAFVRAGSVEEATRVLLDDDVMRLTRAVETRDARIKELQTELKGWQTNCTGRHGSQTPCFARDRGEKS